MEQTLIETSEADISGIVDSLRRGFQERLKWPEKQQREYAKGQLLALKRLCDENKDEMCNALKKDLSKSKVESVMTEYNLCYHDLITTIRDYDELVKPHPVPTTLANKMDSAYIKAEPFGTVLIIGAWNYPIQLVLLPLIGAIGAGNAVVIKPSELSVNTSNLFARLIPRYLDQSLYAVVTGGPSVAQAILKVKFDFIFYTGSTAVGRIVMAEAAKHLTPVVLELGGKSPVIVAEDADVAVAAKRVIFGKLMNTGQTCIAPDYILCARNVRDKFVDHCKTAITKFYSEDAASSPDYGRIVNARHFRRITNLMDKSKATNVLKGDRDETQCFIGPSLYTNVTADDALMQEEIFGPVLPIMDIDSVDEAISFINTREKPLALYVFTKDSSIFNKVANSTSSGSLVQNAVMFQASIPSLPFGGVGHSGMGAYHGRLTFNTFSHQKPYLQTGTKMDFLLDVVYPPYTAREKKKLPVLNLLQVPSSRKWSFKPILLLVVVAMVAFLLQYYGFPTWLYRIN